MAVPEAYSEGVGSSQCPGANWARYYCCGLLVTISHAITCEHHSATWNGEAISEGELLERQTEAGVHSAVESWPPARRR